MKYSSVVEIGTVFLIIMLGVQGRYVLVHYVPVRFFPVRYVASCYFPTLLLPHTFHP
jgi:hypothetical protein